MDVQPGRQLAFDGVADNTGLLAFRRTAFPGVAGPRGDAALGDRRQLELFGEGVQRRLGVRLAGEALSAEGAEGLQLASPGLRCRRRGVYSARCRAARLKTTSQRCRMPA